MAASDVEARLAAIDDRNRRVEADKAWETSWTRRVLIAALTYGVIATCLQIVVGISPWVNAVVPTVAFLVSTLVLGAVKTRWIERRARSEGRS